MQSKKYFILSGLLFLSILLVNSFATEVEKITITDTKQLKGIWEALYIYQETPRQERIDTFRPPLPEKEEFESKNEYQERIDGVKVVYERRVEKNLKKEIKNEQKFKNAVFTLKLTHTPTQDSMNANTEECYEQREELRVLRKKIGTAGLDTGVAGYNAILRETGYPWQGLLTYLKIPGAPFAVPPFSEWRIEETDFSLQENIAYFTFSLDKYNMEEKRFPVIFPLSQLNTGEKEWAYYTKKVNEWEHYTETFKKSRAEKTEQWLIKFDELPTYVPMLLDKAKTVRKNEQNLFLELGFQPIRAEKDVSSNVTRYTLGAKLISATLKNADEILYEVVAENIQ